MTKRLLAGLWYLATRVRNWLSRAMRFPGPLLYPLSVFLVLLSTSLLFFFSSESAATITPLNYLSVYDSGLQGDWVMQKWEGGGPLSVEMAAPAPNRAGTAVEVNFTDNGWNALGFATPDWSSPYYVNEIRTVEFDLYIKPDSIGTENLIFILGNAGQSDQPRLVDYIPGWDTLTDAQRFGHWFHLKINLAAIHPKVPNFGGFFVYDNAGTESRPHILLYNVKIGWKNDLTPPRVTLNSITPDMTYSQATLVFHTDEPTTYRVEYGVSGYGASVENLADYSMTHEVLLPNLTPGTILDYRITAWDHRLEAGAVPNAGVLEGHYTIPPAPTQPPLISLFSKSGVEGHKATLNWKTDRPCRALLTYKKQGTAATMTRTLDNYLRWRQFVMDLLEPATGYQGTIRVTDAFGLTSSRDFTVRTTATSTSDVDITIDASDRKPISPYIYGTNQYYGAPYHTFGRMGGNRWTTYNWENNASNAGSDYYNQNDDYLPWSLGVPADQYAIPGNAILYGLDQIFAADPPAGAALITVPILGHVAADSGPGGDVADSGPDYLQTRFKELSLAKGAPFSLHPSTTNALVYTDEFVNWVKKVARPAHPGKQIFYALDNEPDIWFQTHPRIEAQQESYNSLCDKNGAAAAAIKRVDPAATVFGFVSYGWTGYINLQGAPDGSYSDYATYGDFTEYYLRRMKTAEILAGKRLVDVLDLHYYTSAQSVDGLDVGYLWDKTYLHTPTVDAERAQSARSLWDPTYVENSWITGWLPEGDKPIRLIPRMLEKIEANYPGTKLAITEYNFGGGADISGALAEADALGIFGQLGVFAASQYQMGNNPTDHEEFIEAAFRMYRGFDGTSANFGDISLAAASSDTAKVAVYASLDSTAVAPGRLVLVAINRSNDFQDVALNGLPVQGTAQVYRLISPSPAPVFVGQVPVPGNSLVVALPPMSISTLQLQ